MHILGFYMNDRMTTDTHLLKMMTHIGMEYPKLKPSLKLMDLQTKRIVINTKVRAHIEIILPLIIAQPQYVQIGCLKYS